MSTDIKNMSPEQMALALAQLQAENAKLKANANSKGTGLKVTEKGCVALYGLGRFPVTLYANQWQKIFAKREEIEAFIETNKAQLSIKPEKVVEDKVNVA